MMAAPARASGLNLARVGCSGNVGNGRILGLARAVQATHVGQGA
jgi:hypothetical protein